MNLVTKIVGAVHMFAAFLKVKDLGTGARIFIYKTLYVSLSHKKAIIDHLSLIFFCSLRFLPVFFYSFPRSSFNLDPIV